MASPEERAARLQKTDLREHFRLNNMLGWACTMLSPEDYDHVGMHPDLRDGSVLKEQLDCMQELRARMTGETGLYIPDDAVSQVYVVFDHCQSILERVQGSESF